MSEIHVFATVIAQPGKEGELQAVLETLVTATRQEPGNLHYMLHTSVKTPGTFYFFEVYKDQSAADAHMASPHFAAAVAKAGALLAAPPSIIETKKIAGS
ncbi:MAG: putative quinol monooxygenase [Acidocella sp.]|nr:putative quinol monooxygenase [Acidocella sp.]